MRKIILETGLILVLIFTASCTNSGSTSNTSQVVTSGSWRVTLFIDSGNDETSDFSGYEFTFSTTGSLVAVKNGVSKTGTWSVNNSSGKFNIDLGQKADSNKPLGELTDDWKIISVSETLIQLQDDNPSRDEKLTFTKN